MFNNEEVNLTCPIELGNLCHHLVPCELSWDVRINNNLPEPVENSTYVDEGRKLRVYVDDTTRSNVYRCKLRLRRCREFLQENASRKCDIMVHNGPILRLEVLGKANSNCPL